MSNLTPLNPINVVQGLMHQAGAALKEAVLPEQSERFTGYVCYGAGQPLKLDTFHAEPLQDMDVQIAVKFASLCHTDVTMIRNEVGLSSYPFVPGHEVVGTVQRIGASVTDLKVGDTVGVGFFRRCCWSCQYCDSGFDNICEKGVPTSAVNGAKGGFANYVRVDSRLAFKLPAGIPLEQAPPIFCAGATVYNPLKRFVAGKPGLKVGIVGLGGLGHIGIQIAKAMGAEVYVFSHTPTKRSSALHDCKADHFVDTNNSQELNDLKEKLDVLLVTLYGDVQAGSSNAIFDVVKGGTGTICYLGWMLSDLRINAYPLIYRQRTVVGSNVASAGDIRELLEFWVQHNIVTHSEVHSIHDVNGVLDRMTASPGHDDLRFRAVFAVEGHLPSEILPPAVGMFTMSTTATSAEPLKQEPLTSGVPTVITTSMVSSSLPSHTSA